MVNRSKQKGTAWETEVVRYLRDRGFEVERRALTGTQDRGDITGVPDFTVECKNAANQTWALWMDELERERRNDGAKYGLLVVRRRMKPVAQAYAMMRLDDMVGLMIERHTLRQPID
jgi:Holliday junction resolvase